MSTTKPNIPPNNVNEPLIKEALIPVLGEIWLFIDSQTFGGIETHVLELAKGLLNHGNKVRVVLLTQYMPEPSIIGRLNESALPYLSPRPIKSPR